MIVGVFARQIKPTLLAVSIMLTCLRVRAQSQIHSSVLSEGAQITSDLYQGNNRRLSASHHSAEEMFDEIITSSATQTSKPLRQKKTVTWNVE